MRRVRMLLCLVFILEATGPDARVIFVSRSGSGMNGDSWQSAYPTIGGAIEVMASGDRIWVMGDEFKESVIITVPGVVLLGGFVGTETSENERGDNSTPTVLDGINQTRPVIQVLSDCILERFVIRDGDHKGFASALASVRVVGCTIENNEADFEGGGALIRDATADFINCVFRNNRSASLGGGLFIERSTVTMENCVIEGNRAVQYGGMAAARSQVSFRNCLIANNIAESDDVSAVGGLHLAISPAMIDNTLIYGNRADIQEQVSIHDSHPVVFQNCTIWSGPEEVVIDISDVSFDSSILWGSMGIFAGGLSGLQVTQSCVQGGYQGLGNISDDPLFVDPAGGNFHLQPESPCIDTAGTSGPSDDLDGNSRPADVPGLGRDGTGDEYDMGAYEFQPPVPTPTPTETLLPTPTMNPASDINQSGKVDTEDLLLLIADWARPATP